MMKKPENIVNTVTAGKKGITRRPPPRGCRPGLSMVEILIALAIAALLLTATAVAFDAAFSSYKANHEMSLVSTTTRNVIYQMCSTIRSAWNEPGVDTIDLSADGNLISMVDANGWSVEYRYEPTANQFQVRLDRNDGKGWTNWFVMADDIYPIAANEDIFVAFEPEDPIFDFGTVGKVIIRFQVQRDGVGQTVTASAVPRNVIY